MEDKANHRLAMTSLEDRTGSRVFQLHCLQITCQAIVKVCESSMRISRKTVFKALEKVQKTFNKMITRNKMLSRETEIDLVKT